MDVTASVEEVGEGRTDLNLTSTPKLRKEFPMNWLRNSGRLCVGVAGELSAPE